MRKFVFILFISILAVRSTSAEAALYSQMDPFSPYTPSAEITAPTTGLPAGGTRRASYFDTSSIPGGYSAQSADRFTLASGMAATRLEWLGGYSPTGGLAVGGVPPTTPTFIVGIYTGDAFGTGVTVFENLNMTVVETLENFPGFSNYYSYSVALPSVNLASGTPYWLSIAANFNPVALNHDYEWGWAFKNQNTNSTGDNFAAYREIQNIGLAYDTWTTNSDFAFRLSTEAVPEPSSGIIAIALIGAVVARRRVRKIKEVS